MPSADEVNPLRWSDKKTLFDNGEWSVISGKFDNDHCLGIRWNSGDNPMGFPVARQKPVWFVIPNEISRLLLYDLLFIVSKTKYPGWDKHRENILDEIGHW